MATKASPPPLFFKKSWGGERRRAETSHADWNGVALPILFFPSLDFFQSTCSRACCTRYSAIHIVSVNKHTHIELFVVDSAAIKTFPLSCFSLFKKKKKMSMHILSPFFFPSASIVNFFLNTRK
jgi:hypothetical protein